MERYIPGLFMAATLLVVLSSRQPFLPSAGSATDNGHGSTYTINENHPPLYAANKSYKPDPSTLDKKVMFGYQGWFGTPNDGSGNGAWKHWFRNNEPDSAHATFDYWPDMSEYPAGALEATKMTYANGTKAKLFSAYKYATVDLHFKWMQQHALDGVFEQRFVTEIKNANGRKHFNQVVRNVQRASEKI